MTQYILKRLLLMVPTFLLITFLVFLVINLAPGRPGTSQSGGATENAQNSANQREGYRLFKEQYNLDKPIMLNFRYRITAKDVAQQLEIVAKNTAAPISGEKQALQVGARAASVLTQLANSEYYELSEKLADPALSQAERDALQIQIQNLGFNRLDPIRPLRPKQGAIRDAEEDVENWGLDVVPQLVRIATDYVHLIPAQCASSYECGVGMFLSEVGPAANGLTPFEYNGTTYTRHEVLTFKVRMRAVQQLTLNAKRRVLIRDGVASTEEQREQNREISNENAILNEWFYGSDASSERIAEVNALWTTWLDQNRARFEKDGGDRLRMIFVETRFAKYFGNLLRLDFGQSIRYGRPVMDVIAQHWQFSIYMSLASLLLSYFISIPLGVLAAVRQNRFADRGIGILLFVLYSLPSFFAASLLTMYFTEASETSYEWMKLFPVSGFSGVDATMTTTWDYLIDVLWHMVLPVVCLTYGSLAVLSRYARSGLLDVIRSDYIRTARAKGLAEWVVILKHAVRNGMIPIITLLGTTLPILIGGSIIIEYVFVIEGMGQLIITAIQTRDYNIIMAELLIASVLTLVGILLSDISYALVDPRISFE